MESLPGLDTANGSRSRALFVMYCLPEFSSSHLRPMTHAAQGTFMIVGDSARMPGCRITVILVVSEMCRAACHTRPPRHARPGACAPPPQSGHTPLLSQREST